MSQMRDSRLVCVVCVVCVCVCGGGGGGREDHLHKELKIFYMCVHVRVN